MENSSLFEHMPEPVMGYRLIHGYVSGTICFIGIILNILNGFVWSRKNMRTSTNLLLTVLAFTDGMSLFLYLVYVTYFFTATGPSELIYHSEGWMYIVVICFHEFIAFHTVSNWLTISLAIFRYLKVCQPNIAKKHCNRARAKLTVLIVFIVTTLATIPFYLYYEVYDSSEDNTNLTGYWIRKTTFARNHVDYQTVLLWLYGVIFKVVPSMAMIVLSALLIKELRAAMKRKDQLRSPSQKDQANITTGYTRTSIMLVVIVLIYILMELPVGIMAFLSGIEGGESHFFYFLLYSHVGDIIDMTVLVNATLNFFVYFCISRQYRSVLKALILKKVAKIYEISDHHGEHTASSHDNTNNMELSTSAAESSHPKLRIWVSIKRSFRR
ncbi:G-protein coupled receptor dmsr-1-like [Saccostrea echinata]|uniref:G-protein coupled receptor dmsr-1-like n=1 Tax=Saccostrea echinata TaxID=191078 RepID=UPI002A837A42|nr:G-protein coupled receptor dmsr-1-like [Saccostrea echinata]